MLAASFFLHQASAWSARLSFGSTFRRLAQLWRSLIGSLLASRTHGSCSMRPSGAYCGSYEQATGEEPRHQSRTKKYRDLPTRLPGAPLMPLKEHLTTSFANGSYRAFRLLHPTSLKNEEAKGPRENSGTEKRVRLSKTCEKLRLPALA